MVGSPTHESMPRTRCIDFNPNPASKTECETIYEVLQRNLYPPKVAACWLHVPNHSLLRREKRLPVYYFICSVTIPRNGVWNGMIRNSFEFSNH